MMDKFPDIVLLHLAQFLCPEDTARLAQTCQHLYSILPRYLVIHGKDFHVDGPSYNHSVKYGSPPEIYFDGPPLISTVKKLTFSVEWKDQGWGNLKGEIFVQLMRPQDHNVAPKMIAEKSQIFGIAKHNWDIVKTVLEDDLVLKLAQEGDFFRFMRNIGGGGGHELYVKNFRVEALLNK